MKALIVLALAALATGCGSSVKPEPEIITVYKVIKEPCIDRVPVRPAYNTGKGAWPDDKMAAAILADDFERAEQYGIAFEAATAGCVRP